MNKLDISDSKLDKSEEKTFFSGKNTNLYNLTGETQKYYNETNTQNNLKSLVISKKKSSSQSNGNFFNNNANKPKRIEAENKNSILNKFRIELNKSQSIINRELIRSKDLKLKFLKKRKKQQAEEEAKQLLIKNSPQNLNLINIQNNIINNSTGFKYKTAANINDSINKKVDSPIKITGIASENTLNISNNLTKTNKNNNSKENFFATEVKIMNKTNLKNQFSPFTDKKGEKNINDNNYNKISIYDNNSTTSKNNNIFTEKNSGLNQTTPKEYLSNLSNKKEGENNISNGDYASMNQEQNNNYGFAAKKSFNSGNFTKVNETNLNKLLRKDSMINLKVGISTDNNSIIDNANFHYYNPSGNKPEKIYRIKTYNVRYIKKWFEKNNIPTLSNSQQKYANMDFQSNNIIDQIKVLLDNMNYFKLQYLQGKELLTIFQNLDAKRQIKYNKCLEETCGLLMEISKTILMDFSQYLEKFASIDPPAQERLQKQEVKNEEINFFYNIKLFFDCNQFLKGCFEVYLILVKQLDDMVIPPNTYLKLLQFLARARLNTSNLIFTAKNAFQNITADQKNVTKYLDAIAAINEKEKQDNITVEVNQPISIMKKKTALPKINSNNNCNKYKNQHVDLTEKIRRQFMFKLNDENQRNLRLNNVLNRKDFVMDDSFDEKKKAVGRKFTKESCLNSDLITKLLKYCPREVKNQIISQRIMEMYNDHDFN